MNYQKMISVIPVLQGLVKAKLPLKESYRIFSLAKEIEGQKDFFIEEERKLIEKYHGEVSVEGRINFSNTEDQIAFAEEYFELNNMQVETKISLPIVIKMESINDSELKLSAEDLMSLDEVVSFE